MLAALAATSIQGAQADTMVKNSPTGGPIVIAAFGTTNEATCLSGPLPSAHLNSNPLHGHVTFREGTFRGGTLQDGNTQCRGARTRGIALIYTPDPGFKGTDHFDFTDNPWYGTSTDHTVSINVGGGGARAASRGPVAAPSPAANPPVKVATGGLRLEASAGQTLRVGQHASWSRDCSPSAPPQISITSQPVHGRLEARRETFAITAAGNGEKSCAGQPEPGVVVYYVPSSGFHGNDHFTYQSLHPGKAPLRFAYTVAVD